MNVAYKVAQHKAGFRRIIIVLIVLVSAVAAVVFVRQDSGDHGSQYAGYEPYFADYDCEGGLTLDTDIVEFGKLEAVTPPGSIIAGHWKTHAYYNFTGDSVEVRAPVDMLLVGGTKYVQSKKVQYAFDFVAPCGYEFKFDHISDPIDPIARQLSGEPKYDTNSQALEPIEFREGEVFAATDGNGVQRQFDFGVYNLKRNNGLDQDPRFDEWTKTGSQSYLNAVCPFDLYPDGKKTAYYALFRDSGAGLPDTFCKTG